MIVQSRHARYLQLDRSFYATNLLTFVPRCTVESFSARSGFQSHQENHKGVAGRDCVAECGRSD